MRDAAAFLRGMALMAALIVGCITVCAIPLLMFAGLMKAGVPVLWATTSSVAVALLCAGGLLQVHQERREHR